MDTAGSKNSNNKITLSDITTYQAGVAQATAYRLLKKYTEEAIHTHGITMTQWFIIGSIFDAGETGVSVSKLSDIVGTNLPYITNTLNILEAKGIIAKRSQQTDMRSKVVTINPDYLPTIAAIEQDMRSKMRATLYANLSQHELLTYVKVLQKLSLTFQTNIPQHRS